MAISVTPNLTDVSMCESTTGWAGGIANLLLQSTAIIQGTYSLAAWINNTTSAVEYYTITSADLSTGQHVYVWMLCNGRVDTKANGGYRIVLYTDASNYATFYVGGNDTHGNGWNLLVCDASATPTAEIGTFNPAAVTRIGIQFKTITAATKQGQTYIQNCFWDAVRYGTGLTITSGATDNITFESIYAVDSNSTYSYGVVSKSYGSYIIQGKLILGSATSGDIDFGDSNQVVIFPDNDKVADSFYGIQVLGNSGGTTNFTLGENSGGSGISGCTFKAIGSKTFSLDVSTTANDIIGLYGSNFINAGTITLPVTGTNKEMLNCNITTMDGVVVSTCKTENCNFISADDEAVILANTGHNLKDSTFISNPNAIRVTTAGTYTFDNLQFTGNTVDVDNTSGGSVIINCINTSNPTTYTGSTTFNFPVDISVEVIDVAGDPIETAQVAVYKTSDNTQLLNTDTDSSGLAETTFNYTTSTAIYLRIRKSSTGATKYIPISSTGTISNLGFTATYTLIEDTTATT